MDTVGSRCGPRTALPSHYNRTSQRHALPSNSSLLITHSQFSSVQLVSHVQLFATPWTTAHQASLSITNSWSLLKLMSIELVMPSNPLILYCPLLLLPSIFISIRVFSNESALCIRWPKYWSFSFSINPSNEYWDSQESSPTPQFKTSILQYNGQYW